MLSKQDITYLNAVFDSLEISEDQKKITGVLTFDAVYDPSKAGNSFTIIGPDDGKKYTGTRLRGSFNVSIEMGWFPSGLPKLVILENIPKEARRHFYTDESALVACVCGPVKELRFMKRFNVKDYVETLVIPFLYGQLYFDNVKKEWPWKEYSHNTPGILESYHRDNGTDVLSDFVERLKLQGKDWVRLETILYGRKQPKGHTPCFCSKGDFIRRCHPEAWEGVKKLYADIHDIS